MHCDPQALLSSLEPHPRAGVKRFVAVLNLAKMRHPGRSPLLALTKHSLRKARFAASVVVGVIGQPTTPTRQVADLGQKRLFDKARGSLRPKFLSKSGQKQDITSYFSMWYR